MQACKLQFGSVDGRRKLQGRPGVFASAAF